MEAVNSVVGKENQFLRQIQFEKRRKVGAVPGKLFAVEHRSFSSSPSTLSFFASRLYVISSSSRKSQFHSLHCDIIRRNADVRYQRNVY